MIETQKNWTSKLHHKLLLMFSKVINQPSWIQPYGSRIGWETTWWKKPAIAGDFGDPIKAPVMGNALLQANHGVGFPHGENHGENPGR